MLRLERKEPPPPPAAATSFVVAFVSRRAHGPGSSALKVTALWPQRRSLDSRPPLFFRVRYKGVRGGRGGLLSVGVSAPRPPSRGGVADEAPQSPAT